MQWIPAVLGVLVVIQAGLNRKIGAIWGLSAAVTLNGAVVFVAASTFLWAAARRPEAFWAGVPPRIDGGPLAPWFVLPGLIGFVLIVGGPWSIARWGAVHTFVLLVAAQLAASVAWDYGVEGLPISGTRLLGVGLAALGAALSSAR